MQAMGVPRHSLRIPQPRPGVLLSLSLLGSRCGRTSIPLILQDIAINPTNPERERQMKKAILTATAVGMILLLASAWPDIRRYIRISSM
jgi:hypothetical protein